MYTWKLAGDPDRGCTFTAMSKVILNLGKLVNDHILRKSSPLGWQGISEQRRGSNHVH